MLLFRTNLLIEIDFGNIYVQKLRNDKTWSDSRHSHSDKNHDGDVNCVNSSDSRTQAGGRDCGRIQLDGRSQKYKSHDSTQSAGDTLTVDELDGHHAPGRRRHLPTESGEAVSRSSSFSHDVTHERRQYVNDRLDHYHHHHRHDWLVSPARRQNRELEYCHHVDGYKSKKTCPCDKHRGRRNHSASHSGRHNHATSRSRSRDNPGRRHCESHRNSSRHTTGRHAHYSHH